MMEEVTALYNILDRLDPEDLVSLCKSSTGLLARCKQYLPRRQARQFGYRAVGTSLEDPLQDYIRVATYNGYVMPGSEEFIALDEVAFQAGCKNNLPLISYMLSRYPHVAHLMVLAKYMCARYPESHPGEPVFEMLQKGGIDYIVSYSLDNGYFSLLQRLLEASYGDVYDIKSASVTAMNNGKVEVLTSLLKYAREKLTPDEYEKYLIALATESLNERKFEFFEMFMNLLHDIGNVEDYLMYLADQALDNSDQETLILITYLAWAYGYRDLYSYLADRGVPFIDVTSRPWGWKMSNVQRR